MTDAALWDMAGLIARTWYKDAIRAPFGRWFLYYREAREGEKVAIPLYATEDDAPDGYTRSIAISTAWTTERATQEIHDAMRSLPILGK